MNAVRQSGALDVRMLRIFEAVADSGNVSQAARKLGVTQSAVSQTLSQVEQILGTALFDRSHRPFKLTPAGIALSRRARHIVDDVDRLVSDVREADLASHSDTGGHDRFLCRHSRVAIAKRVYGGQSATFGRAWPIATRMPLQPPAGHDCRPTRWTMWIGLLRRAVLPSHF